MLRAALSALLILALTACGGSKDSGSVPGGPSSSASADIFYAVSGSVDAITINEPRNNFNIAQRSNDYWVVDNVGSTGSFSAGNTQTLKFTDFSVNLGIGAKSLTISPANLQAIIELYIAYFNRIPGADGLSYWIDQYNSGQTIEEIGTSFYLVAIQFSSITGYSSDMTNEAFVRLIYKNVLGRDNPAQSGLDYWTGSLANGSETRGSLIQTMLTAARTYRGDPTYGWVADLLDNKVNVGKWFAVQEGLNYLTPQDAISNGMAIAAAITSTDTQSALQLVHMTDSGFTTLPQPSSIFSPKIVSKTFYSGHPINLTIEVTPPPDITGSVYVVVVDSEKVLNSNNGVTLSIDLANLYAATFQPSPSLAPGHYASSFEIFLCKDAACKSQWPSSPLFLPYDFQVLSASDAPPVVTPSPTAISTDLYPQDDTNIDISADFGHTDCLYSYASDDSGILVQKGGYQPPYLHFDNCGAKYSFAMHSASPSTVGHYTGNVKLHFCNDSACTSELLGSPVLVPYDIQMRPPTNLTPLSRWDQVNDWETFQGNAAHTGYLPVTLDTSRFSQRWHLTVPPCENVSCEFSPAVIAEGLVYVSSMGDTKLFAFRESDMGLQWQQDTGGSNSIAVSGGKVFNTSLSSQYGTTMWVFKNDDGSILSQSLYVPSYPWPWQTALTAINDAVYTAGDIGGIYRFNAGTYSVDWTNGFRQYQEMTPAVDSKYLYAYVQSDCYAACNWGAPVWGTVGDSGLRVLNVADGKVAFTILDNYLVENTNNSRTYTSPVITPNQSVVTIDTKSALADFDIPSQSKKWAVQGQYMNNPVVAGGIVYALNQRPVSQFGEGTKAQLEARSEADGTLLWAWVPTENDGAFFLGGNLIATDNMLLLSTDKMVHAISTSLHTSVWQYQHVGQLSLSANGILYVSSQSDLFAVNLK